MRTRDLPERFGPGSFFLPGYNAPVRERSFQSLPCLPMDTPSIPPGMPDPRFKVDIGEPDAGPSLPIGLFDDIAPLPVEIN